MQEDLKTTIDSILSERIIAFNPVYSRITGSISAGVLLSQMMYWSKLKNRTWFYKSAKDITEETTISRDQQLTIRKRLIALGVIEEKLMSVPATMHYRVNHSRLQDLVIAHYNGETPPVNSGAKPPRSVVGKYVNWSSEDSTSSSRDSRQLSHKITSEITPKNPPIVPSGDDLPQESLRRTSGGYLLTDPGIVAFEEFWRIFPNHVKKSVAIVAYTKALVKGVTHETIMTGLKISLPHLMRDDAKFCPHAATWLNNERWTDDYSQPQGTPKLNPLSSGGEQAQSEVFVEMSPEDCSASFWQSDLEGFRKNSTARFWTKYPDYQIPVGGPILPWEKLNMGFPHDQRWYGMDNEGNVLGDNEEAI